MRTLPAAAPGHRTELWNSMLDAEMNVCYWQIICERLSGRDRNIKFFVFLTSSGTAIAAWTIWASHPELWKVITGISGIAAIYHNFFFSSERLRKSVALVAAWKEFAINYRLLWADDPDIVTTKLWEDFQDTKKREAHVDESLFKKDEKLLLKSYADVKKARGLDEQ
jgi:hypothetical protein